jgi:hypothetical protein
VSYLVEVSKCGTFIKTFFVPMAESGLDACNQTEAELGLEPPIGTVCPQTGKISHIKWHGYMFCARAIVND